MLRGGLSAVLGVLFALPAPADEAALNPADLDVLTQYARDTWGSIDQIAGESLLPSDGMTRSAEGWTKALFTSPTDVAAYLWSTLAAENLHLIDHVESGRRLGRTLDALGRVERSHGFFFNWYDPLTGDRLKRWPGGGPIRPFLSSVDNGWLAAALMMVANVRPELRSTAEVLLGPMNFGFFFDPFDPSDPIAHPGLLRGGYFPDRDVFTKFHYGTLNTEPRIASYIGMARGEIPPDHYFRMRRAPVVPSTPLTTYYGVEVPEAVRTFRDLQFAPTWDGTMFEALMVPLFVPEVDWAAASWGKNHRNYTQAHIKYGLNEAQLGFWGISASCDPDGGYRAFGAGPLGWSNREGRATATITPHASFLALAHAPRDAMDNLRNLCRSFPMLYGEYGFFDAVDARSGRVAETMLTLDQGMILAAIANHMRDNSLQKAFSTGIVEGAVRPVIEQEHFAIQNATETPTLTPPAILAAQPVTPLNPGDILARGIANTTVIPAPRRPRRLRA